MKISQINSAIFNLEPGPHDPNFDPQIRVADPSEKHDFSTPTQRKTSNNNQKKVINMFPTIIES